MNAYDQDIPIRATIKPVWIVDDDRSIRWVLEKALSREGIAYQCSSPTSGCPASRGCFCSTR